LDEAACGGLRRCNKLRLQEGHEEAGEGRHVRLWR
jgi:hypothetical protein